jgi:hypothetical protein
MELDKQFFSLKTITEGLQRDVDFMDQRAVERGRTRHVMLATECISCVPLACGVV